jgi:hypothetical protein
MTCSTRLICRFPARDKRWRTWSPEEASIGAVPFQEAKMPPIREPGDAAGLDQQPCGAGRADPLQGHQRGAGGLEGGGQLLAGGLLALMDTFQVGDQLGGDPPAGTSRDARCRPMPRRPSTAQTRPGHRRTPASIAAYPAASVPYRAAAQHGFIRGHDLDRGRALVRVHPDDDLPHLFLLPSARDQKGRGGHATSS